MSDGEAEYEGTEDDVVEILESRDRDEHPVMSTQQIADHVSVTRRTVVNRLQVLEAGGRVEAVDLGRHKAWYLPSDRFLAAGGEGAETVATDGALPSDESDSMDELLKTQHKMYNDNIRTRRLLSKTIRSAATAIVPLLLGVMIAFISQSAPSVPHLDTLAGFLIVVAIIAGANWLYEIYETDLPEQRPLDEGDT